MKHFTHCSCCQVSTSDVKHVNIIAFRQLNQFEITGNVVTDYQFVSTLKVNARHWSVHAPIQSHHWVNIDTRNIFYANQQWGSGNEFQTYHQVSWNETKFQGASLKDSSVNSRTL